ncbi:MAG: phosphopyruvate hydratase [archaeon]
MEEIRKIIAREILDSRGNPTVEVELKTDSFTTIAAVPSGASTGVHEAIELRDGGMRYLGKGVQKAVHNVEKIIAPMLIGLSPVQQNFIDTEMCQVDGTANKSKLGANAILAVSMAVCRAGALSKGKKLYEYISELAGTKPSLPIPYFNVINGGKHAGNNLDFQEFMLAPIGASNFKDALRMGAETYCVLKELIKAEYGLGAINVGDEGGFAPPVPDNESPLRLLVRAIKKAGYDGKIKIAMDVASSEFYYNNKYVLGQKKLSDPAKMKLAKKQGLTGDEFAKILNEFIKKYPIVSIEDPFAEDDWESWSRFTKSSNVQIVGDDLLVTNSARINLALEKRACNALLLKVNQIGTVSEAIDAANLALKNNWKVMVSHRSGETEDTFIADLVVGLGCGQIKSGAPCRGERTAKYNQLLRIEEHF